jgi:cholesterol oxidase
MRRREFGRQVLKTAAALGLTRVSPQLLSALGIPLIACNTSESARLPTLGGMPAGGSTAPRMDASVAPQQVPGLARATPPTTAGQAGPMNARAVADGDAGPTPSGVSGRPIVAIIGSGYGSAVASKRLTEAGIAVTVFEMGRLWNMPGSDGKIFCSNANPDGRAMWFKDATEAVASTLGPFPTAQKVPRQAGILDVIGPETMRVTLGRGVGGGSLVNLAVFAEPVRERLARVLPRVSMDDMYNTYIPLARKTLQGSECPPDIIAADCYQYSRVGIAAAKAIGIDSIRVVSGYDYDYMRKEIAGTVPKSAVGGEGGYGNNYGKRSLDKTYIADAMGTGLMTIHALTEVTRITRTREGYGIHTREIDIDGHVLHEADYPCTHLFLCAGSIGTSELLVKSRDRGDLPDLNRAVGTQWGPNSDLFVARDNPTSISTGATQCILPSSAFYTRDAAGKPVFSMIIPLPIGVETHVSWNIVMTDSPEAGHFVYDSVADDVELIWKDGQQDPAIKSSRDIFDKINMAVGSTYNEGLFGGRPFGDRSTYHPVGGCPLGTATDDYGRIPHYPGLYVMDGSLLPIGIGANPSLTITALSERNIERILEEDFHV